jgi:hypothetical protein
MGLGVSLILIAIGAILAFAVDQRPASGVDIGTVGVILMGVGGLGLLLSFLYWSSVGAWFPGRYPHTADRYSDRETFVVERDRPVIYRESPRATHEHVDTPEQPRPRTHTR